MPRPTGDSPDADLPGGAEDASGLLGGPGYGPCGSRSPAGMGNGSGPPDGTDRGGGVPGGTGDASGPPDGTGQGGDVPTGMEDGSGPSGGTGRDGGAPSGMGDASALPGGLEGGSGSPNPARPAISGEAGSSRGGAVGEARNEAAGGAPNDSGGGNISRSRAVASAGALRFMPPDPRSAPTQRDRPNAPCGKPMVVLSPPGSSGGTRTLPRRPRPLTCRASCRRVVHIVHEEVHPCTGPCDARR
jgi:hypothetical protein